MKKKPKSRYWDMILQPWSVGDEHPWYYISMVVYPILLLAVIIAIGVLL